MKKWNINTTTPPPINVKFWGYDVFYDTVNICEWDGKQKTDEGTPFPSSVEQGGDDYYFAYWMEKEPRPCPPNVHIKEVL